MVLIGLLIASSICLAFGFALPSTGFFIASLGICFVVALLLVRARVTVPAIPSPPEHPAGGPAVGTDATSSSDAPTPLAAPSTVWVVDEFPDYHYSTTCVAVAGRETIDIPFDQAVEDGFEPCALCTTAPVATPAAATSDVWVVDGLPEYHVRDCATIVGKDALDIPLDQAIEDGFVACSVCHGSAVEAEAAAAEPEPVAEAAVAAVDDEPAEPAETAAVEVPVAVAKLDDTEALDEVWVIDGFPDYHRVGCRALIGTDAEPVPYEQAVEDGFAPCPICMTTESAGESATEPEPEPELVPAVPGVELAEVWVIDGQPEFHRVSCVRLGGAGAEAIPFEQAVEDGFTPCTVCAPTADGPVASEPPTAPEEVVAAAEAEPAPIVLEPPTVEELPAVADTEPVDILPSHAEADVVQAWVVDGYAHYHHADCPTLVGLSAEPIPLDEAIEVGFAPCATCYGGVVTEAAPTDVPEPAVHTAAEPESHAEPAASAAASDASVWVVDGYLNYHREACNRIAGVDSIRIPLTQAIEDGFQPCGFCEPPRLSDLSEDSIALEQTLASEELAPPAAAAAAGSNTAAAIHDDEVWVVDGYPDYHARGCSRILGEEAVPIPLSQATEDGFSRCPECLTDAAETVATAPSEPLADELLATEAPAAEAPAAELPASPEPVIEEPVIEEPAVAAPAESTFAEPTREVYVADGYPYFHEQGCAELEGLIPIGIPFDQATEDGFQPCPVCMLAGARVAPEVVEPDAPEPEPEPAPEPEVEAEPVYVVEGRPRFHRESCMIIKGRDVSPISYEQAVQDGYQPCSLCESGR